MTIFSGYQIGSVETDLVHGNPALGNFPSTLGHLEASETAPPADDTIRIVQQPHRFNRTVVPANYAVDHYGFLDFYNHIHIQYKNLDLGNIVSSQQIGVTVFNAYFVQRTLADVTEVGGDGLILTEPAPTPLVYEPLQQHTYFLTVTTDGPPNVAAVYTFEFDVGDFVLNVTGARLVLFVFEPDGGITETLLWKTDILESYDGSEQRIQIRTTPRQQFDYQCLTEGLQDTRMRAVLFDWLARVFGVPVWYEMRRLTAAHTAGTDTVNVSTAYGDFREDGLVMIYQDEEVYEVATILTFDATTITLQSTLANSYNKRSVAMPVRTAYATAQANRAKTTTGVVRTSVSFTTIENVDLTDTTGANSHDGKLLLDDANFMDATMPEAFSARITVVDSHTGQFYQTTGTDRNRANPRKRWEVKTREDLWRVRRLLHAMCGSRKSFFLPSFTSDLELVQNISAGGTTIRVKNCLYTLLMKARRPFGDLRLVLTNGTSYTREIIDSNVDGADEVISIAAQFSGSIITLAQVERVELVSLVRISNDRAKLLHRRAGTATVDINLITVKE